MYVKKTILATNVYYTICSDHIYVILSTPFNFFYNLSNFATSFSCFAEISFLFRVFSGISRDSCHPDADLEGISSRRASTTVYSKIQYQFRGSAAFRRAVDL